MGQRLSAPSLTMDRIESFANAYLPASEQNMSTLAAIGITAATFALLSIPEAIAKRRRTKKDAIENKARIEKEWADREAKEKAEAQAVMTQYRINITPLEDIGNGTDAEIVKAIYAEAKKFLVAIKKSKVYPIFLEDCAKETAKDPEMYDGAWTAKELDRFIQINEGINGWEESIEVVHEAPQEVNVLLMPITDDLATMLKIRFKNWISGVSTGDGDEGHIYYQI